MKFVCNICGTRIDCPDKDVTRETISCPKCHSNMRHRSVMRELSLTLLGKSIPLTKFPRRHDIKIVGLSDQSYDTMLGKLFDYENTFFHRDPFLDIAQPISSERRGKYDFVLSSDVFEHIEPPISRAFAGAFDLLKPGGTFIITVPYSLHDKTIEHYPDLYDWCVGQFSKSGFVVLNKTSAGELVIHEKPVFHGGPGTVLEMRLFSRNDLARDLTKAGFEQITFDGTPDLQFGIFFKHPFGLPVRARKPR
jgi:SAM-dependent methyltransferase